VLFLAGVALTIGMRATLRFFVRPKNYKGSGFFLGGVSLVVWGWTLVGFGLEAYGFWLLFSAFFPTALSFLRRMPFLRQVLDMPAIKSVSRGAQPAGWVPGALAGRAHLLELTAPPRWPRPAGDKQDRAGGGPPCLSGTPVPSSLFLPAL
jgi:hypothetical protein